MARKSTKPYGSAINTVFYAIPLTTDVDAGSAKPLTAAELARKVKGNRSTISSALNRMLQHRYVGRTRKKCSVTNRSCWAYSRKRQTYVPISDRSYYVKRGIKLGKVSNQASSDPGNIDITTGKKVRTIQSELGQVFTLLDGLGVHEFTVKNGNKQFEVLFVEK